MIKNILTMYWLTASISWFSDRLSIQPPGCGRPRGMGKGVRLNFFAFAVIFFGLPKVALSQEPQHLQVPRHVQASEIAIPSDLGYVIEANQPPTSDRPSPIIIHIQEAHTNYEAQQHIVSILERLIKEHGLKLVMVEGGEGDVSLSYLRHEGTPEKRQAV